MSRLLLLTVATFGVYFIFWFYWVSKELLAYNDRKGSPGLWVIGLGFVLTFPLVVVIPIWKLSQQVSAASNGKYSTFFLTTIGLFILPLVYLTQKMLNEIALEQRASGVVKRPTEAEGPFEPPAQQERREVPELVPPPALRDSPEPPARPEPPPPPEPERPPEPPEPPAPRDPSPPPAPPEPQRPPPPPEPAWPAGQEEPADLREVRPPEPAAGEQEPSQSDDEQRGESNT